MSASLNVSHYCQMPLSRSNSTCIPVSSTTATIEDNRIEVLSSISTHLSPFIIVFFFVFKAIGGYGPNVATDADILELENVKGDIVGLEDDDLITVAQSNDQHSSSSSRSPLRVIVKDALGRTITGASDAGAFFVSNQQQSILILVRRAYGQLDFRSCVWKAQVRRAKWSHCHQRDLSVGIRSERRAPNRI